MIGYIPKSVETGNKTKSLGNLELGMTECPYDPKDCLKGGDECKCKKG